MRRINYMKRAAKRFLAGTSFRIPAEVVEAGLKSLEEWSDVLNEERERDDFESPRRNRLLQVRTFGNQLESAA
jgi:hypothetical protein